MYSLWCIKQALAAIDDYDVVAAKNYMKIAIMWKERGL